VLLLQLDAVTVARLEMLDQHLAGDLVLPPAGIGKYSFRKRVGVAVETRPQAVLYQQLDVLQPVDVLTGVAAIRSTSSTRLASSW